jgi:plastocyanin
MTPDHETKSAPRRPRHLTFRHVAAVAVLCAGFSLAACSSNSSSGSATPTTTTGSTHIVIHNFMFMPPNLTVKPGATITVTNEDSVAHTLTSKSNAFDTGDIQPGKTVTLTAPTKPGSYPYYCMIHQYMTATLTVSG